MEYKIGQIFEIDGEWYQCIKGLNCLSCVFNGSENCNKMLCSLDERTNSASVIFKKLEKAGEPVTEKGKTFQKLISNDSSCKGCVFRNENDGCDQYCYMDEPCLGNEIWIEIKQTKEDMEDLDKIKVRDYTKVEELNVMEENKLNLKPFDIQKAREGKPVCTRDGRKARIICFDVKGDICPIIALVEKDDIEVTYRYNENGQNAYSKSELDLMMLPEKKEGWVNIYKETEGEYYVDKLIHKTEKFAFDVACPDDYIGTVKIEWYE